MTYFDATGAERAGGAVGAFDNVKERRGFEVAPGVVVRPLPGERLMLAYVEIARNSVAEVHTHPEEQMGIVISGSCEFELDGDVRTLREGDTYHAPPGVPHGARTGPEPCVIIDLFSPPRAALAALLADAG